MLSKLEDLQAAVDTLNAKGTILYPTDTIWGLGCDATEYDAVSRVYQIKEREASKSCIILVPNMKTLLAYIANPPLDIEDIMRQFNEATTFILDHVIQLPDNLVNKDGSIAIRIPNDDFCKQLLKKFGKPIVSTSANISGLSSPKCYDDIDEGIKKKVDYICHHRRNDKQIASPSRIVKINQDSTTLIIRE